MFPPCLAYYGVTTENRSMVEEAYTQVSLYRKYLRDTSSTGGGLWKHIVLGDSQDTSLWSTGNGWAAAGILRVLGIYADDGSTFADASSDALLASTVYRLSLLVDKHTHLLVGTLNTGLTSDGWLTPVVNPDDFGYQGSESPKGQVFVLLMNAAYRDWVSNGAEGANVAGRKCGTAPRGWAWAVGAISVAVGAVGAVRVRPRVAVVDVGREARLILFFVRKAVYLWNLFAYALDETLDFRCC